MPESQTLDEETIDEVPLCGMLIRVEDVADVFRATEEPALGARLPTSNELHMFEQFLMQIAANLEPLGPWLDEVVAEDVALLAALPPPVDVLRLVTHAGWIAHEAERAATAARAFRRALENAHADRPEEAEA